MSLGSASLNPKLSTLNYATVSKLTPALAFGIIIVGLGHFYSRRAGV